MSKAFRFLLIVVCVILWGRALVPSFQANQAFFELGGVFFWENPSIEEKMAALRRIEEINVQNRSKWSQRRITMFNVDRLVTLFEATGSSRQNLMSERLLSDRTWQAHRLPEPVPITPELNLLAAVVLSDDLDFAFGKPLRIALWLQPIDKAASVAQINLNRHDWQSFSYSDGFIATGPVQNLIQNPGLENPTLGPPPAIAGLIPPTNWGGEWRNIRIKDNLGSGQVACVSGGVRLSTALKSVEKGQWVMFGAKFRTIRGVPAAPYLLAFPNTATPLATSKKILGSEWQFGYGVVQLASDAQVSLFLDHKGDQEDETCIDNLFLIVLPRISDS